MHLPLALLAFPLLAAAAQEEAARPVRVRTGATGLALLVPAPQETQGLRPLFNGEDLSGWVQKNGTADYRVEDDCVVGTTAEGSPNSFLCTDRDYGDFLLMFQVKVDPRLNSGVQIRSLSTPDYRDGRVHGYQVEIDSDGDSGYVYDESRRGWLSTERTNQVERGAFRPGEWNSYVVVCEGDHIRTFVNGYPVADLTDGMTAEGFIGLQVHSFDGESPAEVRWKNLFIKELD
ncbi:3-keto-disaccharide hydrolase [Tautonia plasticadhaerens]|uniref:3-keto-alpha-glucoside-1,2-lyase/3-keto-2-hydroxy-glucal hydratase domain-containing protein n=1 Tax=Tautonia plasticadhaerens TaxID=2527974 RepID=A0A518H088_9BACT|nr:DUF1080 domain-containing protein [Tautonia plasticadhaerens]QDV34249.1 hypothetical protein ElP_21340 [Tautonia plasticadhaerens]